MKNIPMPVRLLLVVIIAFLLSCVLLAVLSGQGVFISLHVIPAIVLAVLISAIAAISSIDKISKAIKISIITILAIIAIAFFAWIAVIFTDINNISNFKTPMFASVTDDSTTTHKYKGFGYTVELDYGYGNATKLIEIDTPKQIVSGEMYLFNNLIFAFTE